MLLSPIIGHTQEVIDVRGIGTFDCGKYLKYRKNADEAQDDIFVSWVWGLLVGYNIFKDEKRDSTVSPPSKESVLAFLDNYCRNNPLRSVLSGSMALVDELGGRKTKFQYKR
jgi:hypothetical protein